MAHQHPTNPLRKQNLFWNRCAALALILLSACAGSSSATRVPRAPNASPHFSQVAEHLHLGGTAYGYMDFDGDPLKLMTTLVQLLRGMPEANELLGDITAEELVRILGLHNLRAYGFSSYKDGDHFHNRTFLRHTGPREGTMKMRGGNAAEFGVLEEAPSDADVVISQQVNLRALLDIARALADRGVGLRPAMLNAFLQQRVFETDITWETLITKLDTEVSLVARLDPTQTVTFPEINVPWPHTEFSFRAKGLGFLVSEAAKMFGNSQEARVVEDDAMVVLQLAKPLQGPFRRYAPALMYERSTGDLLLVSTRAFFDSLDDAREPVAKTEDFQRAMRDTPSKGNGIAYLSPRLTRSLHQAVDRFRQVSPDREAAIGAEFVRWFLPDAGQPIGWVATNLEDGVLTTSNTTSSHKTKLLLSSGSAVYLGVLAAIAIPAFVGYNKRAKTHRSKHDLKRPRL